jgi:universal stress protein A
VVAAVDLSDASTGAVAFALSLAEEADAHLTLVHALDLPLQVEAWVTESESGADRIDRWRQGALQRLRELVPTEARTYCHVDERVVVGQAYREILRVAAERHAGLIVAGAHARGPVERLFLGSTAQHLVRQAACPVLIVRNRDAKAH